jgi:D-threo-aldose 1-dehydrogenase
MTDEEAWGLLEAAWDAGIRYFDTAPHYGLGLSERRLGDFLRTKPREEFVVSTKAGRLLRPDPDADGRLDLAHDFHVPATLRRVWDFTGAGLSVGLDESCERLGLDRVDVLYLHDPERHDLDLALHEGLPALVQLRSSGRVSAVGVGSMVSAAVAASVRAVPLDYAMVAGRLTLLEQPAVADAVPACRKTGTGIVAASVFNSGLLADETPSRDSRYDYGGVPDAVWDRLLRIWRVCQDHGVPLPAAAVQFPFRERSVASVVVGAAEPAQIAESVRWGTLPLPEDLWSDLAAAHLIP